MADDAETKGLRGTGRPVTIYYWIWLDYDAEPRKGTREMILQSCALVQHGVYT